MGEGQDCSPLKSGWNPAGLVWLTADAPDEGGVSEIQRVWFGPLRGYTEIKQVGFGLLQVQRVEVYKKDILSALVGQLTMYTF